MSRKRKKTVEWRATRLQRHPAMKYIHMERMDVNARGLAHLCMYCEANPVKTPGGDTCSDRECLTRWNSDYAKGRREIERQKKPAKILAPKTCECPCKREFTPGPTSPPHRKYFSMRCERRVQKAKVRMREQAEKHARRTGAKRGTAVLFGKGRRLTSHRYSAG
jgi:hypothetical protein